MDPKHLLVHLDSDQRAAERLELAVGLARRFSARLAGMFAEAGQLGPSVAARRAPSGVRDAAERAREAFAARTAAAGVETEWWPLHGGSDSDIVGLAAVCARFVDLVVLGQPERGNERAPKDLVDHVLLGSGRPVLVVPSAGHWSEVGRRVVVAWTSTRESARAVNDALPLMQGAERVHVVAFQRGEAGSRGQYPMPHLDLVEHLAAHGIAATRDLVVQADEGTSIVEALLNHAFDVQADLTVLGGYGETFPFPHVVRSTKEILRSMPSPVLLSS